MTHLAATLRTAARRRRTLALLLLMAGALSLPGAARAAGQDVGAPIYQPTSLHYLPPGFTVDAQRAIDITKTVPKIIALHRRIHPLHILPAVWGHSYWFVGINYRGRAVGEVNISAHGAIMGAWTGPLALALYARGHYSPLFDTPWVLVPFSLLFLVPFLRRGRLWSLQLVDGLVVLSFLVSYLLFDHAQLEPAVWLVYPPLLYLLGRLLWAGLRGAPRVPLRVLGLSPRWLGLGLLVLVGARIALSLFYPGVIDVGYASVIGANRIAHGMPLYFASAGHGDTYGPVNYLAYLPFELIWPLDGRWDYLISAHAASIFFDLGVVAALIALGRRMRGGSEGLRLGLLFAWVWAACPFTLLGLMMHTNDALVALLTVLGVLGFTSPAARGALLGLAAAAKFSPAALLPLFAVGPRRSRRGALVCAACFAVVAAGSIVLYLPPGGISEFWSHTLGYQLGRQDVFSPWALHPGLHPLAVVLELAALGIVGLVALRPRERDVAQVCALAGAATIAVQLPAVHWFYYYLAWVVPFLAVASLAPGALRWPVPAKASEAAPRRGRLPMAARVGTG